MRFGGATAQSPDDWATRFGPYGREWKSVEGASVSTRQRKGGRLPALSPTCHLAIRNLLGCPRCKPPEATT